MKTLTQFINEAQQVDLKSSKWQEFDYDWALQLSKDMPQIWSAGGNIRGNDAFRLWGLARKGDQSKEVLDWLREREAWAARHFRNHRLPGVIAQIKWGIVGRLGLRGMKQLIRQSQQ